MGRRRVEGARPAATLAETARLACRCDGNRECWLFPRTYTARLRAQCRVPRAVGGVDLRPRRSMRQRVAPRGPRSSCRLCVRCTACGHAGDTTAAVHSRSSPRKREDVFSRRVREHGGPADADRHGERGKVMHTAGEPSRNISTFPPIFVFMRSHYRVSWFYFLLMDWDEARFQGARVGSWLGWSTSTSCSTLNLRYTSRR